MDLYILVRIIYIMLNYIIVYLGGNPFIIVITAVVPLRLCSLIA